MCTKQESHCVALLYDAHYREDGCDWHCQTEVGSCQNISSLFNTDCPTGSVGLGHDEATQLHPAIVCILLSLCVFCCIKYNPKVGLFRLTNVSNAVKKTLFRNNVFV